MVVEEEQDRKLPLEQVDLAVEVHRQMAQSILEAVDQDGKALA